MAPDGSTAILCANGDAFRGTQAVCHGRLAFSDAWNGFSALVCGSLKPRSLTRRSGVCAVLGRSVCCFQQMGHETQTAHGLRLLTGATTVYL